LVDAPLYIDEKRVRQFYNAVFQPDAKEESIKIELNEQNIDHIRAKLNAGAEMELGGLLQAIKPLLPKIGAKVGGEIEGDFTDMESRSETIELNPIDTPEKQLIQLTLRYLADYTDRLFFTETPSDPEWRDPDNISQVPRELVFLDFPGLNEAHIEDILETKLVPTAAEFETGAVAPLYNRIANYNDQVTKADLPKYIQRDDVSEEDLEEGQSIAEYLRQSHKEYWSTLDEIFRAKDATRVIEDAASDNEGRIEWIDYRVRVTDEGDTLHLHITPRGEEATGVFAYNFVKRAFKHGIRIVGVVKSEPDMDVLAIYNK
jgi:hypothetical protein